MTDMTQSFSEKDLQIQWIEAKALSVIWVEAQRPFNKNHAKKIADNYDFDRFDPVRVTLPNGKGIYHIVEGQHRHAATVMRFGDQQRIPCIVAPVQTPAEAAQLFDGVNGMRWRVDPVASYRVRLTAGEQTENAIERIIRHRGYKVGSMREGSRNINAVGALISIFHINGPKVLDDVLQVLSATWPADPRATTSSLLRGYGALLGEYGSKVNWQTLKENVSKKYTPGSLIAFAKTHQEGEGGSMTQAVKRVLVAIYNKTQPQDKKLRK
jgi:hypothetical protein